MFTCGISEKGIADTSGHRSTKALRCYERKSEQKQQDVTAVINNVCVADNSLLHATSTNSDKPLPQDHSRSIDGTFTNCIFNFHAEFL